MKCQGWDGPCESKNATQQRQNTAFVNDERNFVILCPDCMKKNIAYWNEQWAEYYEGCM